MYGLQNVSLEDVTEGIAKSVYRYNINIGHGGYWIDLVMKIYKDKYLDLTKVLPHHIAMFSNWQHENLHEK